MSTRQPVGAPPMQVRHRSHLTHPFSGRRRFGDPDRPSHHRAWGRLLRRAGARITSARDAARLCTWMCGQRPMALECYLGSPRAARALRGRALTVSQSWRCASAQPAIGAPPLTMRSALQAGGCLAGRCATFTQHVTISKALLRLSRRASQNRYHRPGVVEPTGAHRALSGVRCPVGPPPARRTLVTRRSRHPQATRMCDPEDTAHDRRLMTPQRSRSEPLGAEGGLGGEPVAIRYGHRSATTADAAGANPERLRTFEFRRASRS